MKRLGILISLVALSSLVFVSPVLAVVPDNDLYADREAVSIGFTASVNTTEATTDATDDEINDPINCAAPATDASVWYELTVASDVGIAIDVSESSYAAGVIVATGGPGTFAFVTCGPNAVAFDAVSGETYAILVFDDQLDGTGIGGTLEIAVVEAPPPPEVSLTVNRSGRFNSKTGSATISGTVTCTGGPADFSFIDVFVRQAVGRIFIDGAGFIEGFVCDGTAQTWSAEVFGFNGTFRGGKAVAVTFAVACGPFSCGEGFVERVVQLKGGKK